MRWPNSEINVKSTCVSDSFTKHTQETLRWLHESGNLIFLREKYSLRQVLLLLLSLKRVLEREKCQHVREAKSDMNAHDTWTRGAFWTLSGIFTLNLKFFFCDFSPLETTFKSIGFANKNLLMSTMLLLVDDLEKLFDGVTDVFEEIKKVNVEFVFEVDLARLFFSSFNFLIFFWRFSSGFESTFVALKCLKSFFVVEFKYF